MSASHSSKFSPLSVVQSQPETYVIRDGVKVTERFFTVPLDYSKPDGQKIRVHARSTLPLKLARTAEDEAKLPYIVFLQGGPGMEVTLSYAKIIMNELHDRGYQVLWLDQRGTGMSTPICGDLLDHLSDNEKADYLKNFRSDNIVRDCEHIRHILLGQKENPEDRKWTLLGQSYGGWCSFSYLSFFPEGLKEVFLTGGMAGLMPNPDHDYEKLVQKVVQRNGVYYEKYPQDVKRVRNILTYLDSNKAITPNGGNITVDRFLQLGIKFGMKAGIDEVHELVLRGTNDLELFGKFSYKLTQLIEQESAFDGNPLYAIMQENIYCQGHASNWSAARAAAKEDRFSWEKMKSTPETTPVYFQGEMMSPSMLDDYPGLRPFKKAAEILAAYDGWGPWYDEKRLSENKVPINAATYVDDMYVDFELAQDTARKIPCVKQFITNQMYHDALRKNTKEVLAKLFEISRREDD